jgi:glyoxylase-like metal-dependent hydrolase (beta-lactamase superfamily II)
LDYRVSDLERILVTHAHPDHYGLAAELVRESGAKVAAHPHSEAALAADTGSNRRATAFYRRWLAECGVPSATQDLIGLDRNDGRRYTGPVEIDAPLVDGDVLLAAGRRWRVLSTPGHSGGLLCLFEPETRILLSSDHLIGQITSNPIVEPPPPGQSDRPKRLLQYLDQLERVAALGPSIAYSGHGPPITDVAGLVAQRIAFHHRRADGVYQKLLEGPRTVYAMVRELFPKDLPPVHLFLALSEVQGHLDLLAQDGRAGCAAADSVCMWAAN